MVLVGATAGHRCDPNREFTQDGPIGHSLPAAQGGLHRLANTDCCIPGLRAARRCSRDPLGHCAFVLQEIDYLSKPFDANRVLG